MHVGIINHWEAWLYGVEVMAGLDLRHGQSYCCAETNAMEGNLLGSCWDVMQMVDEQRAPGIDGRCSYVCRQMEFFQLYCQG